MGLPSPADLTLEQAFEFFFERSDQAYYVFDPDSLRFLAVNQAAVRRYGYTKEDFRDLTVRDIRPAEDVPVFMAANIPLGQGVKRIGRFRHRSRDGEVFPVEIATYDILVEQRYLRLVEAIDLRDTARLTVEMRAWEDRFRPVAESLSEGLVLMNLRGIIQYANPMAEYFLGLPREEAVGRDIRQFVRAERRPLVDGNLRARGEGQSAVIEDAILRPDGSLLWTEIHSSPFHGPDGTVIGAVSTFIDIAERRKAQDELRHSLSLLQATLESTTDGILVVDRRGMVTSWNETFRRMWRVPRELMARGRDDDLLALVVSQLKDPEPFLQKVRHLYRETPHLESFDVLEFVDGRIFERYSQPQRVGDDIVGRVWSFRDVTERRRAEEQILQAQKVEAIGLLAGGVAHDFNNVLTAILGSAELALLETEGNDRATVELEEIRRSAMSASRLTRQLLLFSRKREHTVERLNLNAVVRAGERMLQRLIPEDVSLTFQIDESLGDLLADPGELEQVLMNLALNARDACERGGAITIATMRRLHEAPAGRDGTTAHAVLRVSDTGDGMTPEVHARMFEPFFTTKAPGKGTGLGLPAVLAIVERSGGHLVVQSTPSEGTTVEAHFPEQRRLSPASTPAVPEPRPGGASESILIVEDAPALRRSTRRMLEQQGYTVSDAANGVEALEVLATHGPDGFALVLTDVVMPRMGGRELAGHILRRWPSLKVMLMTGYDDGGVPDDATRKLPLLEKPFARKDLLAAVRRALDGPTR